MEGFTPDIRQPHALAASSLQLLISHLNSNIWQQRKRDGLKKPNAPAPSPFEDANDPGNLLRMLGLRLGPQLAKE